MGLPEGSRTSLAEALESSAVQLFVQAAQRGQPAFRLTDDNLTQVLAICRRVAGLPLGIVLAAAWLRLLSPAEVVAELEGQGLDFLETDRGGCAGAPAQPARGVRLLVAVAERSGSGRYWLVCRSSAGAPPTSRRTR